MKTKTPMRRTWLVLNRKIRCEESETANSKINCDEKNAIGSSYGNAVIDA